MGAMHSLLPFPHLVCALRFTPGAFAGRFGRGVGVAQVALPLLWQPQGRGTLRVVMVVSSPIHGGSKLHHGGPFLGTAHLFCLHACCLSRSVAGVAGPMAAIVALLLRGSVVYTYSKRGRAMALCRVTWGGMLCLLALLACLLSLPIRRRCRRTHGSHSGTTPAWVSCVHI